MSRSDFLFAAVSAAVAFALAWAVISLILRRWTWEGGRDRADGFRKLQSRPVLRVGGVALYAVFILAALFSDLAGGEQDSEEPMLAFLVLGSVMFFLGFLDDLRSLPAIVRLAVQIAVGVAAYACDIRIDMVTDFVRRESVEIGGLSLVLTVGWFVAIPNLINLVDGLDGLAGGIALFLCLTLAAVGMLTGNADLFVFYFAMVGGVAAFLRFNLPPARIYMGDGGAYLLGFTVAASSIMVSHKGSIFGALLVVVLLLGFPILDTAVAVLRRGLGGLPIMKGDARHLHHRMMTLGFTKRNIVFVLYGVFAGLSLLGLAVFLFSGYALPILGMAFTVGAFAVFKKLGLPHSVAEAKTALREILAARRDVRYAYSMAQVLEHDLERFSSPDTFWEELRGFLRRLDVRPAVGSSQCVTVGGGTKRRVEADAEDGRVLARIALNEGHVWVLDCPKPSGGARHWERVLRCFVPALVGGELRWGGYPSNFGIETICHLDESSPVGIESPVTG